MRVDTFGSRRLFNGDLRQWEPHGCAPRALKSISVVPCFVWDTIHLSGQKAE